jgi:hypothetical protein
VRLSVDGHVINVRTSVSRTLKKVGRSSKTNGVEAERVALLLHIREITGSKYGEKNS